MDLNIKKVDDELQVVYGEVYVPDRPDAQGDFMTAVELRKMAHRFLAEGKTKAIDTQHDNRRNGSYVVESFVARDDDALYIPGAWVAGVKVEDPALWQQIKRGEITGFSMEALVHTKQREIEFEVPETIDTQTLADDTGHVHTVRVSFNEDGDFLGGETGETAGHSHPIKKASVTELVDGHVHRFTILEHMSDAEIV